MLQKAFFKTDVLNPTKITNVLLDHQESKTTYSKNYIFVVPEGYNNVVIEYAGGSGGYMGYQLTGGGGSIKRISVDIKQGDSLVIEGIIGGHGSPGNAQAWGPIGVDGGQGYANGEEGFSGEGVTDYDKVYVSGGGGGGSTSVVVNGVIYESSGGGGAASGEVNTGYGGAGGGAFGGARKNNKKTSDKNGLKGNDATDPEQIGLNKSSSWDVGGYIKVYGNYDPYL